MKNMTPEIRRNDNLIASVPDETGTYKTLRGNEIYVNTDLIDADAKRQAIILESDEIGGNRVLGLTQQGIGNSKDRKRGDKKDPEISVSLLDKPIRVSYNKSVPAPADIGWTNWGDPDGEGASAEPEKLIRQTVKNPRWIRKK